MITFEEYYTYIKYVDILFCEIRKLMSSVFENQNNA